MTVDPTNGAGALADVILDALAADGYHLVRELPVLTADGCHVVAEGQTVIDGQVYVVMYEGDVPTGMTGCVWNRALVPVGEVE